MKPVQYISPWVKLSFQYRAVVAACTTTNLRGPGTCVAAAIGCTPGAGVELLKSVVGVDVWRLSRDELRYKCQRLAEEMSQV